MGASAYADALRLLGRRDHFRSELVERLRSKGHPPDEVEDAVARCEAAGVVDDPRLADRFVELRAVERGWGPRRLEQELRKRGAPTAIAEKASRLEEDRLELALETAIHRAARRAPAGWWRVGEARARMVNSLIRRGFSVDDARRAVDRTANSSVRDSHALDDEPRDPGDVS
jgi:regulatory protein